VSVRTACAADAAVLAQLSTQLGYPADTAAILRRLARIEAENIGVVFVAQDGHGRVLGWTHVLSRLLLEQDEYAELVGLVVDDGARSAGIGALLLSAAEDWARSRNLGILRVRSNVVRERAHRFYLRAGYVERKRQVVFEKTLS